MLNIAIAVLNRLLLAVVIYLINVDGLMKNGKVLVADACGVVVKKVKVVVVVVAKVVVVVVVARVVVVVVVEALFFIFFVPGFFFVVVANAVVTAAQGFVKMTRDQVVGPGRVVVLVSVVQDAFLSFIQIKYRKQVVGMP